MGTSPSDLLERAKNAESLEGLIRQGIGGALLAIATAFISGVLSFADLFIKPINAFGAALGDLVTALFGSPAKIIIAGAQASINSLLFGWNLGPFTFVLAIAVVLLGLWLVQAYRSEEPTSNIIPGLGFDVPTPGLTGPEEDDDDS